MATPPPTVQSDPLPPVPPAINTLAKGPEGVTMYQWFVQLREKINAINSVLASIAGATNPAAVFDLLSPLTTNGDMLTYSGGNNIRFAVGSPGQFLQVVSGFPSWQTVTPGGSPLTTKGDIFTFDTADARLPVGADTYVLSANSAQPTGLQWVPAATPSLPVTTKGDLLGFNTVPARIPVGGTNGWALVVDSTQALGVKWAAVGGSYTPPVTTKGDLFGYSTTPDRIPVGSDGQVLSADSTQPTGVKWVTESSSGYPSGTSFPGSPLTDDVFFRTDLGFLCYYDGTQWLTMQIFKDDIMGQQTLFPVSAGNVAFSAIRQDYQLYLLSVISSIFATAAQTVSNHFTVTISWLNSANSPTTVSSYTTLQSLNTWAAYSQTINAALSTSAFALRITPVATGSPGTIYPIIYYTYRLIVT